MATPLIIVGAGGFGREVLCLVRDIECASPGTWDFKGFVAADVPDPEVLSRINASYLGSPDDMTLLQELKGSSYVVAIGDGTARERVTNEVAVVLGQAVALIHPTAMIGQDVRVAHGVVVCAGCTLTTNISVEAGSVLDRGTMIGHDCSIGHSVTLGPRTTVSGNVVVHDRAYLGTASTVLQGITIGEGSTIGAGAVVTRGIPAGVTAVGIPATPHVSR